MIIKKVRFKNFFSSGNAFIEIDLQKYNQTVISGVNGNGKSTLYSAITFAIFGKTIKSVVKKLIPNSINKKNCLVEVDLEANNKEYTIRRGIKPDVFEIIENGTPLDQVAVGDFQEYLEQNIIKCSYRTFLQTSIISIEKYKPFMQLPAKDRREFIEDVLDIRIFSVMNTLVKSKVNKNKEEIKLLEMKIKSIRDKIILQKSHIDKIESMVNTDVDQLKEKNINDNQTVDQLSIQLSNIETEILDIKDNLLELKNKKNERDIIIRQINDLQSNIKRIEKDLVFFETNSDCPTCLQNIEHTHVSTVKNSRVDEIEKLKTNKNDLEESIKESADISDHISEFNDKLSEKISEKGSVSGTINQLNRYINERDKEILALSKNVDLSKQKEDLTSMAKEGMMVKEKLTLLNEEQDYNVLMIELFKDTGIKSSIVDQYIPVINKLVNYYLEQLDFFVSFNLDSEFNEIIKSRHRDEFTYDSFSAGERQRIDIALLFTFRQLAKLKNSFSCNLLLIDELLDSSVDDEGVNLLLKLFTTEEFSDTNIFVISHGKVDLLQQHFDGAYSVYKRDGFTQYKETN